MAAPHRGGEQRRDVRRRVRRREVSRHRLDHDDAGVGGQAERQQPVASRTSVIERSATSRASAWWAARPTTSIGRRRDLAQPSPQPERSARRTPAGRRDRTARAPPRAAARPRSAPGPPGRAAQQQVDARPDAPRSRRSPGRRPGASAPMSSASVIVRPAEPELGRARGRASPRATGSPAGRRRRSAPAAPRAPTSRARRRPRSRPRNGTSSARVEPAPGRARPPAARGACRGPASPRPGKCLTAGRDARGPRCRGPSPRRAAPTSAGSSPNERIPRCGLARVRREVADRARRRRSTPIAEQLEPDRPPDPLGEVLVAASRRAPCCRGTASPRRRARWSWPPSWSAAISSGRRARSRRAARCDRVGQLADLRRAISTLRYRNSVIPAAGAVAQPPLDAVGQLVPVEREHQPAQRVDRVAGRRANRVSP